MKILEITDDSGFIGIANFDKYNSFISEDWDFDMIKSRIIEEMNLNNLLFWSTGFGNNWKVGINMEKSNKEAFREETGVIEVSNKKLYLTNYESLSMAAQFEDTKLPEEHLDDLYVELENGKYTAKFRQLFDPDKFDFESEKVNFEITLLKIDDNPELYSNRLNKIYWSIY